MASGVRSENLEWERGPMQIVSDIYHILSYSSLHVRQVTSFLFLNSISREKKKRKTLAIL